MIENIGLDLETKRHDNEDVRVKTGFLADFANISDDDGKVNALGVFECIRSKIFPVSDQNMAIVLAFEVFSADAGQKRQAVIKLLGADGTQHGGALALDYVLPGAPVPHPRIVIWQPVNVTGINFPGPGDYEFSVSIDNQEPFSVPLMLLQTGE